MKYHKIGRGKVLRCYASRIKALYGREEKGKVVCRHCAQLIGEWKDGHIKMRQKAFTAAGTKVRT